MGCKQPEVRWLHSERGYNIRRVFGYCCWDWCAMLRSKVSRDATCTTKITGQTPLFPRIFGHEAGGRVQTMLSLQIEGEQLVELLRINTDRGAMLSDGQTRFTINGKPIYHFLATSTFSEYTVAHAGCVAEINPAAPLDKVCLLSCGFSTGFGATVNVAKPEKGSTVAIFGLGVVGLAAAEGARVAGASRIIGVDLNPNRFEIAKKFGVTEFINPKDHDKPVQQVIIEATDRGVDRSVDWEDILWSETGVRIAKKEYQLILVLRHYSCIV